MTARRQAALSSTVILLLAVLSSGCHGRALEHHRPSQFVFQTRNASGAIPLIADPPATELYLEPTDPSLIQGHAGPLLTADRTRALTLGEWLSATGEAGIDCDGDDTLVSLSLRGLVPNGVYTVWALATTVALRYDPNGLPTFFAKKDFIDNHYLVFIGPAGLADASDTTLTISADGTASYHTRLTARVKGEPTCIEELPNWSILLDYHPDGKTFGAMARPPSGDSEQAAHLGFLFAGTEEDFVAPK